MHATANPAEYYQGILDAMPIPVLVVDDDVRILDYNRTAAKLLQADRAKVLHQRGGEVLHCLNSTKEAMQNNLNKYDWKLLWLYGHFIGRLAVEV